MSKTGHVNINNPPLKIYDDLNLKLFELRSKRDAVLLSHRDLKIQNDHYNKLIIYLSLFTAFFETVKAQLELTERDDFIAPMAVIAPIFLSTLVSIISAVLKFKKFPEKMEEMTKATEKCAFTILRVRQLIENVNFKEPEIIKETYNSEVLGYYREALDSIEKSMYPRQRMQYFAKAQNNLVIIHENEFKYNSNLHKVKVKVVDLKEQKINLSDKERALVKYNPNIPSKLSQFTSLDDSTLMTRTPSPQNPTLPRTRSPSPQNPTLTHPRTPSPLNEAFRKTLELDISPQNSVHGASPDYDMELGETTINFGSFDKDDNA